MTYRDAKIGAAIAGAVLFTMPVLDVFIGIGSAGPVHLLVGTTGAVLIAISGIWQ
jgi:hypothetical protein